MSEQRTSYGMFNKRYYIAGGKRVLFIYNRKMKYEPNENLKKKRKIIIISSLFKYFHFDNKIDKTKKVDLNGW